MTKNIAVSTMASLLIVSVFLLPGCSKEKAKASDVEPAPAAPAPTAVAPATPAPAAAAPVGGRCQEDGPNCLPQLNFKDENQKLWTIEELQGKVVIINFWATYCVPCQTEVPELSAVHKKYKDRGVVVLGLLADEFDAEEVAAFKEKFPFDYPVIPVTKSMYEAFGAPQSLPANFIYSRTGHLKFGSPGAVDGARLEEEISALL